MASLDQIEGNFARGPNGEFVVRRPGAGWARVSEEEYNALRQSRGGRVMGGALDAIQDTVGFLFDQLDPTSSIQQYGLLGFNEPADPMQPNLSVGERIMAQNDPRQAARAEADPLANLAGNVIGFGAELAIPGPPVSRAARARSAGSRIGTQAAEDGAARALGRADAGPGSVTGLTTGQQAEAAQRGLTGRIARVFDDPANAPDPVALAEARRLGLKLTPGDIRGGVAVKNFESSLQRKPAGQAVFEREIMRPNQERINQLYRKAIGLGDGDAVRPEELGVAVDRVQAGFSEIAKKVGNIDVSKAVNEDAVLRNVRLPSARAEVQGALNNIPKGKISGDDYFELLSSLRSDAAGLLQRGDNSAGEAIDQLADSIENYVIGDMPRDVADTLRELEQRWRMIRIGERGRALTEEGDVGLGAMSSAMRSGKYTRNQYRRGRTTGVEATDDFVSAIRTMNEFRERIGNSGTPTGQMDLLDPRFYAYEPFARAYLKGMEKLPPVENSKLPPR